MHDLAYDAIHDEIVVTSPLTQAILTFRGNADGEEAPIRIIQGAKTAFLQGDQWAYLAGIIAVLLGAALVFLKFPKHEEEERLLASYRAEDT